MSRVRGQVLALLSCSLVACQTDYNLGLFADASSSPPELAGGSPGVDQEPPNPKTGLDHPRCLDPCPFPINTCVAGSCIRVQPARSFSVGLLAICVASDEGISCSGGNSVGQLGRGAEPEKRASFEQILAPHRVGLVSGGVGDHFMGLDEQGEAYVWGNNYVGALGLGDTENRYLPELLEIPAPFALLAPGNGHSCVLSIQGELYCMGRNSDGELGLGDTEDRLLPTRTPGEWASVSVGWGHTCALDFDGGLYCWGLNEFGQLGLGDFLSRSSPSFVADGFRFISAEGRRTCAIDGAGDAFCWGENANGQVGVGHRDDVNLPEMLASAEPWVMIAGGRYSACGITRSGALYCWGMPLFNVSPAPSELDVLEPERVGALDDWTWVKPGYTSACAEKSDESVWCWGANYAGQFGTGDEQPLEFPTKIDAD